jgi:chromosome segregation ATPase
MTSNGSNRLDRIEAILESLGRRQEDHERRQEQIDRRIESNARAIQAMIDGRVQERLEHEQRMEQYGFIIQQHETRMQRLEEILNRVVNVQEGLTRMLVSLDDDRPTILRRLNSIENKVDQILERERE